MRGSGWEQERSAGVFLFVFSLFLNSEAENMVPRLP